MVSVDSNWMTEVTVSLPADLVAIMSPTTPDTEHTEVLPYVQDRDPDHRTVADPGSAFCLHLVCFAAGSQEIMKHPRNCITDFTLTNAGT